MEEMEEHGYILRTKCIKKYSYRHTSFNYLLDHKHQSTLCHGEAAPLKSASREASVQGVTLKRCMWSNYCL